MIFLNKAYDYIHKQLIKNNSEINTVTVPVPLGGAVQEYPLVTYLENFWCMAEEGVYIGTEPLAPLTIRDKVRAGGDLTNDPPTAYYVTPDSLGLVPVPSSQCVTNNPTIYCRYYPQNAPLELGSLMPWSGIFNEPMSTFMTNIALLKGKGRTNEITALYNALEGEAMAIAAKRVPV
ncbi:MAG: hypothetical protein JEZ12_21590 [Desulfobacterium sp.]|nr:hypothetical protein [Desulfobacterium sp.]